MTFKLDLSFGPKWENISIIRKFIKDILSVGIISQEEADKVATTISELMENLVKYTSLGGAIISIDKDAFLGKISLEISNLATHENIETFKKIFSEIMAGDAKDAYKKRMLDSIRDSEHSQLGLVRIRYECNGELSYEVSDDVSSVETQLGLVGEIVGSSLLKVKVQIPVILSSNV